MRPLCVADIRLPGPEGPDRYRLARIDNIDDVQRLLPAAKLLVAEHVVALLPGVVQALWNRIVGDFGRAIGIGQIQDDQASQGAGQVTQIGHAVAEEDIVNDTAEFLPVAKPRARNKGS